MFKVLIFTAQNSASDAAHGVSDPRSFGLAAFSWLRSRRSDADGASVADIGRAVRRLAHRNCRAPALLPLARYRRRRWAGRAECFLTIRRMPFDGVDDRRLHIGA